MSEGWYPIFSERRSGTKKCEKTRQMVRLVLALEDPDQMEHPVVACRRLSSPVVADRTTDGRPSAAEHTSLSLVSKPVESPMKTLWARASCPCRVWEGKAHYVPVAAGKST